MRRSCRTPATTISGTLRSNCSPSLPTGFVVLLRMSESGFVNSVQLGCSAHLDLLHCLSTNIDTAYLHRIMTLQRASSSGYTGHKAM